MTALKWTTCAYVNGVIIIVDADILLRQRRERDDSDPVRAQSYRVGHFNGLIDPETLQCRREPSCPRCNSSNHGAWHSLPT